MVSTQGSNLVAYDEQFGSLTADVRLDGRDVTVSDLVIEKPQPDGAGRLTANATYDLDQKTYTVDLQSQDLRLIGLLLPDGRRIRGDVQKLTARGTGSVDSPEGTVDLDVNSLEIVSAQPTPPAPADQSPDASQLGRVVISAAAKGNQATITASAERFNLDADALIGLTRPWPATVKLRAENLDLASLPGSASADPKTSALQGQLRATIDASGNLSEPEKGQATVALEALDGTWNGRPFKVASPSPIRYADERLMVEKVELAAGDASLTITGDLPLTEAAGSGKVDVNLHGSLATVDAVPATGHQYRGRRRLRTDWLTSRHLEAHRAGPDADR